MGNAILRRFGCPRPCPQSRYLTEQLKVTSVGPQALTALGGVMAQPAGAGRVSGQRTSICSSSCSGT